MYKNTNKIANPLKFKVGTMLFDNYHNPPILVRVEICHEYAGEVDFVVQGVYNPEYIRNYLYDSHDYTGDGPDKLDLTLAVKVKSSGN